MRAPLPCEKLDAIILGSGISGPSAGIYLRRQDRLEVALLLPAVDKSFPNPRVYHILFWPQSRITQELRRLDSGVPKSRTSLHIYGPELPERAAHYTINAALPLPRGARGPSPERRANIRECVLETIESGLPAFRQTPNYDAARDIIFFGTSVGPPGEHAGATSHSGVIGVNLAVERLLN